MGSTEDRASQSTLDAGPVEETLADPSPRLCRYARGPTLARLTVGLESITPILGGATVPRRVDEVDFIRVPTLRGHLRFWWRALYAHECRTAEELARRERALWGGVGRDEGARSRVELRVEVTPPGRELKVQQVDARALGPDIYYALWTAREEQGGREAAYRWLKGLRFQLRITAPVECMGEVENTVRAWVLWGGYGARTRRGLGSVRVTTELSRWLPPDASAPALRKLLPGTALLGAPPEGGARPVPLLRGARLFHGQPLPGDSSERAWAQALGWLRNFRQQEAPYAERPSERDARYARESGGKPLVRGSGPARPPAATRPGQEVRPGRTRWPEPDKVRQLLRREDGKPWAHLPRAEYSKSKDAAWPRASFGLPLAIRFQTRERRQPGEKAGRKYPAGEPEDVQLKWRDGPVPHERLASPLIVKAMPLSTGGVVPVALWLCRAWPGGEVVLVRKDGSEVKGSGAPFDRLVAQGDTAVYAPLQGAGSLRDAFFGWLAKYHPGVKESVE